MSNIGSTWNIWDLHFHTPSSFDYQDKSVTNEDIVTSLVMNNVRLIAVTDHNLIDNERIKDLQIIAGNNLTVLPGIEVRTGCGTGENIHIIGIFPCNADIDKINRAFLATGGIDEQRLNGRKDDEIYVNLDTAINIIHDNMGIVTIHAGKKENGLEIITNKLPTSSAIKQDIAKKIDIFEMGKIQDIDDYKKHVFPSIGFSKPMIICSDNHNINNYSVKSSLWIKAEPTFEGLRQVLVEFEDRIFIGDRPEKLKDLQDNKNKYVKSLSISPQDEKTGDFGWFENINVEFNPGLISIIGNKGSG
ncbi:MAG: PHP domain-containing protein, partial [Alphaproteobacteria bacterium]|nr:PHP domain-containing protein [Alphaproteobacteria bacterium]